MRKYYYIVAVCTILVIGLVVWPNNRSNNVIGGLNSPDAHIKSRTLGKLIKDNHLEEHLPVQFNLGNLTGGIDIYKSADRDGHSFWLAKVIARLYTGMECGYSFVFNEQGVCLLCKPDWGNIDSGGLYDINQDGKLEKIVEYAFNSYLPEEFLNNQQNFQCVIQIWQIEFSEINLLFEVQYNEIGNTNVDNEIITLRQVISQNSLPTEFTLMGKSEIARIYWDTTQKCFSIKGDNSGQWKQVFPQKEK